MLDDADDSQPFWPASSQGRIVFLGALFSGDLCAFFGWYNSIDLTDADGLRFPVVSALFNHRYTPTISYDFAFGVAGLFAPLLVMVWLLLRRYVALCRNLRVIWLPVVWLLLLLTCTPPGADLAGRFTLRLPRRADGAALRSRRRHVHDLKNIISTALALTAVACKKHHKINRRAVGHFPAHRALAVCDVSSAAGARGSVARW